MMEDDPSIEYPGSLDAASARIRSIAESKGDWNSQERLIYAAAELGDVDATRVASFLIEHVLPICEDDEEDDATVRASRMRELVQTWIESLPEPVLWAVRGRVVSEIIKTLMSRPRLAALYTLSVIGYRSEETVNALRSVGSRNDSIGHEALRLLAGISPDADTLEWIKRQIENVEPNFRTRELLTCVTRLRDTRFLDWLAQDVVASEHPWLAVSRFGWLADDVPGDVRFQTTVWQSLTKALSKRKDGWLPLIGLGGLIDKINSPEVVRSLLSELVKQSSLGPIHPIGFTDRLLEAVTPTQLTGWNSTDNFAAVQALRPFVERSSGNDGPWQTVEGRAKDTAIQGMLCSGSSLVPPMIDSVLREETNRYSIASVMNAFSVLSVPLPSKVLEILDSFEGGAGRERNDQVGSMLAAARLASSSLNLASLRALLAADMTVGGDAYRAPVESAFELAVWLAQDNTDEVIAILRAAVDSASVPAQCIAVRSLACLLHRSKPLAEDIRSILKQVAVDETRKFYVRVSAISAMASPQQFDFSADLADLLRTLSRHPDENISVSAVSALVARGSWDSSGTEVERLLQSKTARAAYLLGQLMGKSSLFAKDRAIELLRDGTPDRVHALLAALEHHGGSSEELDSEVLDAIVLRVRRDETGTSANPPVFRYLAKIIPARLVTERWAEVWQSWMPDSRGALAEALPTAVKLKAESTDLAASILRDLLNDGVFSVRRAAARSLARIDIDALRDWINQGQQSAVIRLRSSAAEAASWLPADSGETLDNSFIRQAQIDSERVVRAAANASQVALRKRMWSDELMKQIVSPYDDANLWVLKSYAAGNALQQIGDDHNLAKLKRASRDASNPPNVRYWLGGVAENLSKQWKKTTEDWPHPTENWSASLELLSGYVISGAERHVAKMSLWRRHGDTPDQPSSWGGAALLDGSALMPFSTSERDAIELAIEGRSAVQVLIVESSFGTGGTRLTFIGNGPYPDGSVD